MAHASDFGQGVRGDSTILYDVPNGDGSRGRRGRLTRLSDPMFMSAVTCFSKLCDSSLHARRDERVIACTIIVFAIALARQCQGRGPVQVQAV